MAKLLLSEACFKGIIGAVEKRMIPGIDYKENTVDDIKRLEYRRACQREGIDSARDYYCGETGVVKTIKK